MAKFDKGKPWSNTSKTCANTKDKGINAESQTSQNMFKKMPEEGRSTGTWGGGKSRP